MKKKKDIWETRLAECFLQFLKVASLETRAEFRLTLTVLFSDKFKLVKTEQVTNLNWLNGAGYNLKNIGKR